MKTLISSEYGLTISGHVTALRQWLSEKNTDYIIICNSFDKAYKIHSGRYIPPFVTNISISVFTENTELGVSMIYNAFTPALADTIRYTYTYSIRKVSTIKQKII